MFFSIQFQRVIQNGGHFLINTVPATYKLSYERSLYVTGAGFVLGRKENIEDARARRREVWPARVTCHDPPSKSLDMITNSS